ncbi:hypothetical protein VB620_20580 [Nodularia harveyana UHCC-0300]|uniref:Uncharacterized protein n=1 Tax=Nodularia harveyana UHCC-0300 TaxID=2974287 RepID=A0ABU5UKW0_9CYAN|nr:hypothetical protein [Nodularia harveyana]MEA5583725.1 hypothetical protein [Nodularia harveyana UHCC-0300]
MRVNSVLLPALTQLVAGFFFTGINSGAAHLKMALPFIGNSVPNFFVLLSASKNN